MNAPPKTLVIVDDEAPARERLERLVAELPDWESLGSAATAAQALERIAKDRPAVVLLDIKMPVMSGIELARHLDRLDDPPAVIFTTAYDQYALEAFDAHAVGYLLKPVRRERLEDALARAARLSEALLGSLKLDSPGLERRRHVAARVRDQLRLIPVDSIRYFEAEQKDVSVYHAGGVDLIEEPLKQLELEFGDLFVRIHRSMLVAVAAIEAVEKDAAGGHHVCLRGDDRSLPVSRRQVTELKSRLSAGR
jgi:two-component system response regulator AlgR